MLRPRLIALFGLILLTPLVLVWYAMTRQQERDPGACVWAFESLRPGAAPLRLSAWSERAPGQSPQFARAAGNNRDLPASALYPPGGVALAPLLARKDLTYLACSADSEQQIAALWFALFDRAALEHWLAAGAAATWPESERYRPASDRSNPDLAEQLALSRAWLRWLNLANPDLRPGWVQPANLEAPDISGWLQGGVLINAGSGRQLLWISAQPGLGVRQLLTCGQAEMDPSQCQLERARVLALPTMALLARQEPESARLEAQAALAAVTAPDLQNALASALLGAFRQTPTLALDCPQLFQALLNLDDASGREYTAQLQAALAAEGCAAPASLGNPRGKPPA